METKSFQTFELGTAVSRMSLNKRIVSKDTAAVKTYSLDSVKKSLT